MRAVPYESIAEARSTRRRRGQRGRSATDKRWTVGHAMLLAVVVGLALWSVFGAALYWVLA